MNVRERLPLSLKPLDRHEWLPVAIGKSRAAVWRIGIGETALFLKAEPNHELAEMPRELLRLDYLAEMGFPAPRVVDHVQADDFSWLLMTAVKGQDLTRTLERPVDVARMLAEGLRRLHALDPVNCPFDHALDQRLADAERNLAAGLVDESDFDDDRQGWTGQAVFDWLVANRPAEEERVVTHGDACLPNVMSVDGRFSGVVDCARLGVADRWQDLALACRSLQSNGGTEVVGEFLSAYGTEFDAERYTYYCTLDEMF